MLRSCLVSLMILLAPSAHAGSRFGGGGLHAGRGGFHGGGVLHQACIRFSTASVVALVVSLAVTAMVIIAASVSTAGFPIMAMAMAMAAAREMPSAVAAVPAAAMYRIPKAQIFRPLSFPLTAGSAAPLTTHLALISGRS